MRDFLLNALWWAAIALSLFWMLSRGGCGMMGHGHGHGHHSRNADDHARDAVSERPIDPVCGMEIDPAAAVATRLASRETYVFCSKSCVDAFDMNPTRYVRHREEHAGHHRHAC